MPVTNRHFVNGKSDPRGPSTAICNQRCSDLAVLGAPKGNSGNWKAYLPPRWDMPGGQTRNAAYRDVCSGMTGHAEVALVIFDPGKISYAALLRVFLGIP